MANNPDVFDPALTNLSYSNFLEAIVNGFAIVSPNGGDRKEKTSISVQTLTEKKRQNTVGTETIDEDRSDLTKEDEKLSPRGDPGVETFEKSTQAELVDFIPMNYYIKTDENTFNDSTRGSDDITSDQSSFVNSLRGSPSKSDEFALIDSIREPYIIKPAENAFNDSLKRSRDIEDDRNAFENSLRGLCEDDPDDFAVVKRNIQHISVSTL